MEITEPFVLIYVGGNCFLASLILICVFASNHENLPAGFRLLPASRLEWVVLYFHLVESLTLIALQLVCIAPNWSDMSLIVFVGMWMLLLISGFSVTSWNPELYLRELSFCFVVFLLAVLAMLSSVLLQGVIEK